MMSRRANLDPRDTSWHERAACAAAPNPEIFYPIETNKAAAEPARAAFCSRCEVKTVCLLDGLNEDYGVWGGLSEKERRKVRKSVHGAS
jgi:WhiB family redox-sensing transcriptional regulator